jgi:hypothetical protein
MAPGRSRSLPISEQFLQTVARSFDSHSHRRRPRARESRDLVVLELLDVPQQEGLTLFRNELPKRALDVLPKVRRPCRGRNGRKHHLAIVRHESSFAPNALRERSAAPIHEDGEQPRSKRRALIVLRQRFMHTHKGFLRDIFCIGTIAEHASGVAKTCRGMSVDQGRERSRVAAQRESHELFIGHSNSKYLG